MNLAEQLLREHMERTNVLHEESMANVRKHGKRLTRLVGDTKFTVQDLHHLEAAEEAYVHGKKVGDGQGENIA